MPTPYWFQTIAKRGRAVGIGKADIDAARAWYREQARKVRAVNVNRLVGETPSRLFTRADGTDVGSMLMFFYDPKGKDTLPYWDQFPLVFVIEYYRDHFLDLNLHYLPPGPRANLMDALYTIAQYDEKDQVTRLNLSYGVLKNAARFNAFKPCVKSHLFGHMRSRFFYVPPREWDMALMLPTQRFVGGSAQKVWGQSMKSIKGRYGI